MRLQTIKFLQKILLKRYTKLQSFYKLHICNIISLQGDGNADVRQAIITILCKLKNYYGMGFFGDKLKDIPAKKVVQIFNHQMK